MTQAQPNHNKPPATLGAQAAAAATATPPAKPTEPDKDVDVDVDADDDKKTRISRKVYVVVGTVHEFDSVNKAEKFLNATGAPSDYTVLRGNRIGTSKKVSLR